MLTEEDALDWFKNSAGSRRIDFLCRILRFCSPLELRYFAVVLEDMCRKDYHELQSIEYQLNSLSNVQMTGESPSLLEKASRHKLLTAFALLRSDNQPVGQKLFDLLVRALDPNGTLKEDAEVYEEALLLLLMAANHPAFLFDHRKWLWQKIEQFTKGSETPYDDRSQTETSIPSPVGELSLEDVKVTGVQKRFGQKNAYEFAMEVVWSDKSTSVVCKTYAELFDFQNRLLNDFPAEGGKKNRIIPYLPGKKMLTKMLTKSAKELAEKRLPDIAEYARKLVKLPRRLSQCAMVLDFFRGRGQSPPLRPAQDALAEAWQDYVLPGPGCNKLNPLYASAEHVDGDGDRSASGDGSDDNVFDPAASALEEDVAPPSSTHGLRMQRKSSPEFIMKFIHVGIPLEMPVPFPAQDVPSVQRPSPIESPNEDESSKQRHFMGPSPVPFSALYPPPHFMGGATPSGMFDPQFPIRYGFPIPPFQGFNKAARQPHFIRPFGGYNYQNVNQPSSVQRGVRPPRMHEAATARSHPNSFAEDSSQALSSPNNLSGGPRFGKKSEASVPQSQSTGSCPLLSKVSRTPSPVSHQRRRSTSSSPGVTSFRTKYDWFKSLRLHKYYKSFENKSFNEMCQLSDSDLEALGLIEGPRRKFAMHLERLKNTPGFKAFEEESSEAPLRGSHSEMSLDSDQQSVGELSVGLQELQVEESSSSNTKLTDKNTTDQPADDQASSAEDSNSKEGYSNSGGGSQPNEPVLVAAAHKSGLPYSPHMVLPHRAAMYLGDSVGPLLPQVSGVFLQNYAAPFHLSFYGVPVQPNFSSQSLPVSAADYVGPKEESCFNCGEVGHVASHCPTVKSKISSFSMNFDPPKSKRSDLEKS
eukprot:m.52565 g.52565  ORF g.52565 m.52565 type:complete len:866 (+) comp34217_c0_seq10:97-2694(+)